MLAADKASGDVFGWSVALSSDGNTALIGASEESDGGTVLNGAAYVFTRTSGVWTQQQKILASDKANNDNFGWSVALSSDGNTALIGAAREDDGPSNSGAAYVFTRTASVWTQQQKILAADKASGDVFGNSVALSSDGNTALIGAPLEDDGAATDNGAAYVFTLAQVGQACSSNAECPSGFCTDGVCCNSACAGGVSDCQACSVAAGAASNGLCGPTTGNTCNDGNGCTQTDTCQAGTCTGSNLVTCTALSQCHDVGTCNPATGVCSNPTKDDGTACNDGDACTTSDACQAGTCTPGPALVCND
ncbi:MAG: hypothetical protein MUF64_25795, partial [Polyangiaceae bacterium]|nr:hypothetical protein [Polyangiaceae bacterium]